MIDNSSVAAAQFYASAGTLGNESSSLSSKKMNMGQIEKASKDFESLFISQMVEQMFGDSEGDSAFGSSETNDVYKGMMMDEYGKQISKAGGIGVADYVKRELMKLQEVQ